MRRRPVTIHDIKGATTFLTQIGVRVENQEQRTRAVRKGKCIMIAEDDDSIRKMLQKVFVQSGYEVVVARDGREALKQLSSVKPDLLLADVMMPKIDGFKLAHHVRRRRATKHLPVVFVTARSDPQSTMQGMNTGASAYFTKPFNVRKLLDKVERLLFDVAA